MAGVHEHQNFPRDSGHRADNVRLGEAGSLKAFQIRVRGEEIENAARVIDAVARKKEHRHILAGRLALEPLQAVEDVPLRGFGIGEHLDLHSPVHRARRSFQAEPKSWASLAARPSRRSGSWYLLIPTDST